MIELGAGGRRAVGSSRSGTRAREVVAVHTEQHCPSVKKVGRPLFFTKARDLCREHSSRCLLWRLRAKASLLRWSARGVSAEVVC